MHKLNKPDSRSKQLSSFSFISRILLIFLSVFILPVREDVYATGQRLFNDKHQPESSRAVADLQAEILMENKITFLIIQHQT